MAKVRKDVARDIRRNCSVLSIVKAVVKNEEYTKWDVTKVFFWCCWYKGKQALHQALKFLVLAGSIILAIYLLLLLWVSSFALFSVLTIVSPLWYPIFAWIAPKRAAHLLTEELEQSKNGYWRGIWDIGYQVISNVFCCLILNKAWGWLWKYLPMEKRQYYIDATEVKLDTLSVDEQLAYYRRNPSTETVRKMSFEAVDELRLQYKSLEDLKNIGDVYEIYESFGKELFTGSGKSLELLKSYCADEKKRITEKFTGFLIETVLKGEGGELWSRASSLLLICCENHTLPNHQLIMMAASLGKEKPIGNEAKEMLERYFSRNTFSSDVVQQIIMFATDAMADEAKEKNFEILCKIVRRHGLSTELAELFFSRCDSVQNAKLSEIINIRMEVDIVTGFNCSNEENFAKWKQLCSLQQDITKDAQILMKEWQYDIFHQTGHKLDADVIYELLVKRLSKDEMTYFMKVLSEEADRGKLSDSAIKIMMMTPWKRDILLSLQAGEQSLESGALCFDN